MEYIKTSESEMEVTKDAPIVEPIKTVYSIDFLKEQEISILKSMNEQITQRQKELDEVRALLVEAEKLGLKTKEVLQSEKVIIEEIKLEEVINK